MILQLQKIFLCKSFELQLWESMTRKSLHLINFCFTELNIIRKAKKYADRVQKFQYSYWLNSGSLNPGKRVISRTTFAFRSNKIRREHQFCNHARVSAQRRQRRERLQRGAPTNVERDEYPQESNASGWYPALLRGEQCNIKEKRIHCSEKRQHAKKVWLLKPRIVWIGTIRGYFMQLPAVNGTRLT